MKRISILILALITLCACNTGGGNNSHADVSICCPADNSVNGYRTSSGNSSAAAGSMPDEIPITSVKPGTGKSNKKSGSFVGNKKSHVFHKSSCASAKKDKGRKQKILFNKRRGCFRGIFALRKLQAVIIFRFLSHIIKQ